jgi:Cytochrome c554 and c-prime
MRVSSVLALALLTALLGFLVCRPFPHLRTPTLFGIVTDDRGNALPEAHIRIKAQTPSFLTDKQGRFRLPGRPGTRLTAAHPGFRIGGILATGKLAHLVLQPIPEDTETYQWVSPDADPATDHACANCHVALHREWSDSAHARSATGRRFRNLYEGTDWKGNAHVGWSLTRDKPDGIAVCTACHAPTASGKARFDLTRINGVAARGVHCDYCHKIADVEDGRGGLNFGRFTHRLVRPAQGQLFFGPLDDVDRGEDVYSPLYRDSRYCASCHEGVVFGVHVYSTYSEWLSSPAGRSGRQCQDCHMAPTGTMTNLAPGHGGVERSPATLGNHRFFQPSQEAMLARCLKLDFATRRLSGSVRVDVSLRAEDVGHRVPTGFVDRQLLLVVEASDAAGRPVEVRTGPRLPSSVGPALMRRAGRLHARQLRDETGHAGAVLEGRQGRR